MGWSFNSYAIVIHDSFYVDQTAAHCKPTIGDTIIIGALCPYSNDNCGQDFARRT